MSNCRSGNSAQQAACTLCKCMCTAALHLLWLTPVPLQGFRGSGLEAQQVDMHPSGWISSSRGLEH